MDFWSRQAQARQQTRWLVIAFIIALLAVVVSIDIVIFTLLSASDEYGASLSPVRFAAQNPGIAAFFTLLIVAVLVCASMFRSLQLREGGGVVARALGGVRVERDTTDFKRKRLLNVVEEMSIASGVPMPEVYVLERETSINAFAAGHTPANAAVAVTRGALERLNREQLQGVIAHEFSHILNGDMRLNIQLIGWLFGLLVLALLGRLILRVAPRGRKAGVGLIVVALALVVLGYVGMLAGRIIQAAVSRQRERLADASAVQFTRNPHGLKEALLKIAGCSDGSRIRQADAEQVAHMLFAEGLDRMFATHPPLLERIRALDPHFKPKDFERLAIEMVRELPPVEEPAHVTSMLAPAVPAAAEPIAEQVGNPETIHIRHAHTLRLALPASVQEFSDSTGRARALVLALLLSRDEQVRARQLEHLARDLDSSVIEAVRAAIPDVAQLSPMLRLPALQQLFPALRRLPEEDRRVLLKCVDDLIRADARIEVFEFCLAVLLATLLNDELQARKPHGTLPLAKAQQPIHVLFSVLARLGSKDDRAARMAYEAGMHFVFPMHRPPYAVIEDWPRQLGAALPVLEKLHPFAKKTLIEGLVKTLAHDGYLHVAEAELLRTVCAVLHCPLPPLLPQAVAEEAQAPSRNGRISSPNLSMSIRNES
ncbi:MAG TPA: M48 family metallopeptidase [Steroidobacteraceae bacterium]